MDLEDFCTSLLVHLRLILELLFVFKKRFDGIVPGIVSLAAVKMSFGKFVVILYFFFLLNLVLVELFALIILLSFHQNIAMVLNLVHFLDTKAIIG